jgi:hypothetical protein
LRDIAESDWRDAGARDALKEPKPPPVFFDALLLDAFDDDDDDRCDEKPLLKDEEPEGLASAGMDATDRARLSTNAAWANFGAYFESVFSMVRRAVES